MNILSFKKFLEYFITIIFIITLNFFIPRLMPGDPFVILSSDDNHDTVTYSEEQIQKYKAYYGLDKPVIVQYKDYLLNLTKGDLGYSIYYNEMVSQTIKKRILWTFMLVIGSICLSSILGIVLGCYSAFKRDSRIDKILYSILITISEIPGFLIGILFLFILAAKLNLFPLSGAMSNFREYGSALEKVGDIIYHAALPVLTLTISKIGSFYLISRNSTISVLSKDYIKTARAKGLGKKILIFRHALRNSLLPIVTRIFLSLGSIVGGAVLVENVFTYPGLGKLMKDAVFVRDYPLIQGIFLVVTFMVILMNFLSDIIYKKLDPRVK